ncbi:MAG: SRPBCC family protein [Ferruginibacter sp.]
MRMIKGFVIVMFGLFLMVTLLSLFIPSKVMTVKAVVIYAPAEKITAQIADLKNWKNWHPVFKNDPAAVFSNPSVGVNAYVEWVTANKKNKLLITESTPLSVKAMLIRPGEKDAENTITIVPVKDATGLQVEWRVLTKLKWYPWEKFAGIFIDKITGPGYETALNNLKDYLEQSH